MKPFLVILLLASMAFAQKPKEHRHWVKRHPAVTGLAIGAGTALIVGLRHHAYKCYNGEYYTGTPWSGAGPNGCPAGQVKK